MQFQKIRESLNGLKFQHKYFIRDKVLVFSSSSPPAPLYILYVHSNFNYFPLNSVQFNSIPFNLSQIQPDELLRFEEFLQDGGIMHQNNLSRHGKKNNLSLNSSYVFMLTSCRCERSEFHQCSSLFDYFKTFTEHLHSCQHYCLATAGSKCSKKYLRTLNYIQSA